jgi:hypothetical protein
MMTSKLTVGTFHQDRVSRVSSGYCLGVIVLFMISIFTRVFTWNVLVERWRINNDFTQIIFFDRPQLKVTPNINWTKLYPFQTRNDSSTQANVFDTIKNKITDIEKKIEMYTIELLIGRIFFVETAVRYEIVLGWNLHETVFDLGDGFLTELIKEADVQPHAVAFSKFNDFLIDLGIDLVYVQAPHKICRNDVITDASDFSNKNADALLSTLSARDIPYLDLRERLHQEQLDHHSLFYKTDHHWKAETGLWASNIIAEYLNANNGFMIDTSLFAPDRYRYEVYENANLGSLGRKITLVRTATENGTLIYPRFDTDFSIAPLSETTGRQGTFDIFYKNKPTKPDYQTSFYDSAYSSVNKTIHNNLLHDGKKILVIGDSFGKAVVPFLAIAMENIETISLPSFSGSVKTYIEQSKPDMVIVLYNPSILDSSDPPRIPIFDFR